VELVVRPVAMVRSPFGEKVEAPRQGSVAADVVGTVEVFPEYGDALADLDGFDRIWLVFWFDRADGWRPKVLPPRSEKKRGVFATRSPHRPNPIGMTAVRLERIDGRVLHVRDLDLVDNTPILDIKPYVPYADAFPDASTGWLGLDPERPWTVAFEDEAERAMTWIATETGFDLRARIASALSLGPQPHAYRRIKRSSDGHSILAVKEWRACFHVTDAERTIVVERIMTGYRSRDLERGAGAVHDAHRAFVERFG
jgi:tRNA-Thr(GGU) m(6)t(6)A37 methyltransferase TsaA